MASLQSGILVDLPQEVLIHICSFLTTYDRLKILTPTCKYLCWLLDAESKRGTFWNTLSLDGRQSHFHHQAISASSPISSLHLENFESDLLAEVLVGSGDCVLHLASLTLSRLAYF